MLELHQVSVKMGLRPVIRKASLRLRPGEVAGLFGANGAGKTTLLKILGLVLRPTSGEVRIDGRPVTPEDASVRQKIGWLAHEPFAYGALSGRENLALFGRIWDREGDPGPFLRRVGLGPFADDPVGTYSQGMGRRLDLARLLFLDPPFWLLDEPLAGLDQRAKGLFRDVAREARGRGRSLLVVSHERLGAQDMLDRVLLLKKGSLTEAPSVEEGMRAYGMDPEGTGA